VKQPACSARTEIKQSLGDEQTINGTLETYNLQGLHNFHGTFWAETDEDVQVAETLVKKQCAPQIGAYRD